MAVDYLPQAAAVWYPMFQTGEVDIGTSTPADLLAAYLGTETYEKVTQGKGYAMKTVMHGSTLRLGMIVTGDSDIKTLADLKGRKVSSGYGTFLSVIFTQRALLANAGLAVADIVEVPVSDYTEGVRAVIEGRADAAVASVGSGITRELKAAKGARILPIDPSPEAVNRMQEVNPGYSVVTVKPGPPGVDEEIPLLGKSLIMVSREDLADNVVYEIVKALWENYKEMGPVHPMLKSWTPDKFASLYSVVPYHAGAIKWYKEKGVWTSELEAHQKQLLALKK
jgi:hypothetical protein